MEKATGVNVPPTILFQAPTIEKLATILSQEGWKPHWSPLVAVRPHGSRPPFFCVHGGFGGVLFYGQLARSLGPDQPLYALQAEGLDGGPIKHSTIPSMASWYLGQIRQVQASGPYFLGGYSFGGVVAFEMAQQLAAAGEEVALLVLFDAADYNAPLRRYSLVDRIDLEWQSRAFSSPQEILTHLLHAAAHRLKAILGRRLQDILFLLQRLTIRKAAPLSALEQVQLSNRNALSLYTLNPYQGQITLFRAEDPDDGYIHPIDNGWTKYAQGGLQIYKIPGQHQEIFSQPNVGVLAEKLELCLGAQWRTCLSQNGKSA
jgi:thioesterase domain-containing protein